MSAMLGPLDDRLARSDAVLLRDDLAELGWPRGAVDAIFRTCPIVKIPGYRRPAILVSDYRAAIAEWTYHGDRVRPT